MSTDALLAEVRELLAARFDEHAWAEQRSIGGARTFTVRGHMIAGVGPRLGLMIRVGPDAYAAALREPHVAPMQMGSKQPVGFVVLAPEALAGDGALAAWIDRALRFNRTLPAKAGKPAARRRS